MDLPKCKSCGKDFNLKTNKPLILPKCGHTYCNKCISKNLKLNKYMICPLDEKEYQEFEIEDFPLNKDMIIFLTNKKKILCREHKKCLDYYCITDLKEICALCGLFGEHKEHKITTKNEIKNLNDTILRSSSEKIENFIFSEDFNKFENISDLINSKIKAILKINKNNLLIEYNVF